MRAIDRVESFHGGAISIREGTRPTVARVGRSVSELAVPGAPPTDRVPESDVPPPRCHRELRSETPPEVDPRESSTAALVQRIQERVETERSFELLHRRHGGRLAARLRNSGALEHEVHDLVQSSFLQAFVHLARLREPAAFGGWLWSIAANLLRESRRRDGRLKRRALEVPLLGGEGSDVTLPIEDCRSPDAEDVAVERERGERIRRAIEALPETTRHCIVLRYYQGLDIRQIAMVLRTTPAAAKMRLSRGRRALRASLARDGIEGTR